MDGTQQVTILVRPCGTFPSLVFLLGLSVSLELLQTCRMEPFQVRCSRLTVVVKHKFFPSRDSSVFAAHPFCIMGYDGSGANPDLRGHHDKVFGFARFATPVILLDHARQQRCIGGGATLNTNTVEV